MTLLLAALTLFGPAQVAVAKTEKGYQLLVDGKPYLVRGVGGNHDPKLLKELGGNTFRTWGVENLDQELATAEKLGLKVVAGIWLGHKEHGFSYDDPKQVAAQLETVKAAVAKYRNHPALLMWALGNEMEAGGTDVKVWTAIEDMAKAVKKLDPNHPTMTVLADLGEKSIPNINTYCPSLDVIGINSYGGAASLYDRYTKVGGIKPYMLTEFGPLGPWESAKTSWGRPIEATSTEKETWYSNAHAKNVVKHPELCLGSFAFLWGNKQESTATWFGMFLPDGTKTGAVDVMSQFWTGKAPANPCPRISPIQVGTSTEFEPEEPVEATVQVADPKGSTLKIHWVLTKDGGVIGTGGGKEDVPDAVEGSVISTEGQKATIRMPKTPGPYRLFVIAKNATGGAATANIPLKVRGEAPIEMGAKAKLPLTIYAEGGNALPYSPSGWMGSTQQMKLELNSTDQPHTGAKCLRWDFTGSDGWGAIAWFQPEADWGDKPGGYDLTGAKTLSFWARGTKGGEELSFALGIIPANKTYYDTAIVPGGTHKLSTEWRQYEVSLKGKDLRRIKGGFVMTVKTTSGPVTVYLDDIRID